MAWAEPEVSAQALEVAQVLEVEVAA